MVSFPVRQRRSERNFARAANSGAGLGSPGKSTAKAAKALDDDHCSNWMINLNHKSVAEHPARCEVVRMSASQIQLPEGGGISNVRLSDRAVNVQ